MKKITFGIQVCYVFVLMGVGHLLAYLLQQGFWINVAWVLCGILFLVNPVYPTFGREIEPQKGRLAARIGGILVILMGFMIRNGV